MSMHQTGWGAVPSMIFKLQSSDEGCISCPDSGVHARLATPGRFPHMGGIVRTDPPTLFPCTKAIIPSTPMPEIEA